MQDVRLALRGLAARVVLLFLILGLEALTASYFIEGQALSEAPGKLPHFIGKWGVWIVRCCIGFATLFAAFAYLGHKEVLLAIGKRLAPTPFRKRLIAAHFGAMTIFAFLSAELYGGGGGDSQFVAAGWVLAGGAAVALLAISMVPLVFWRDLARGTQPLWLYAATAAICAASVGEIAQSLWVPASKVTFGLVRILLSPFTESMIVQPEVMRIGTPRFTAIITPACSGLEGVALLIVFGVLWLLLFRKEIRFPQALVLLPTGILILFLLNAVRIAVLIMIGNAGARDIAAGGFHSQAGWITFNCVAFGIVVAARRVSWFSNRPISREPGGETSSPVSGFVIPFLAILAAGMISRAMSGSFEWLYSLRLFAALGALWLFRRTYSDLLWKPGWMAIAIGFVVFALWVIPDWTAGGVKTDIPMPAALAAAPLLFRILWIALRVAGATVIVPLAEELAFRAFLLRRFVSENFEVVPFRKFTWFALIASSVLFGLLHGDRWLVATLAGALYALACIRSGRFGDAVFAHATTNALLAVYVLVFQQWHHW